MSTRTGSWALSASFSCIDDSMTLTLLSRSVLQVGDAYIVVGGIASSSTTPAVLSSETPRDRLEKVLRLAIRLLAEMKSFRDQFQLQLHLRIGVHSGDVVSGIVGTQRIRFCESNFAMVFPPKR